MYPNIKNKKNTNAVAADPNVRDNARIQKDDEESLLETGNQNMINVLGESDDDIFNHNPDDKINKTNNIKLHPKIITAEDIDYGDDYVNVKDLDNMPIDIHAFDKIDNINNGIIKMGVEKVIKSEEKGSGAGKTGVEEKKEEDRKEKLTEKIAVQKAPQIINLIKKTAVNQKQNGGIVSKEKLESQFEKDARINGLPLFEGEVFNEADELEEPEEDNISVASENEYPKRTFPNKAVKSGEKIKNDADEDNDLPKADMDMKIIQGQDFTPIELPERRRTSAGSRFLTGLARFFGKTLGKVINLIITPFSAFHLIRGNKTAKKNENLKQKKRTHDLIPGWNGKKFEEDPEGNANILADFRRVPTVWSKLTAAKAVDSEGKPLQPEVSIYVNQPKEGVDEMMDDMNSGHSGIGIEYTRFSKASGRYERYNLRFGFWQAGTTLSTTVMNTYKGALTLGQLSDESSFNYTISRKFKANSKQVNAILNAARTYPDKGYNPFTRNCTTFVRDMMQVGNIAGAKNAIEYEETDISHSGNLQVFGAETILLNAKAGQERNFAKLGGQEDKSYAGWGNLRATQEDYNLYKESLKNGDGLANKNSIFANTPNDAAENLRRMKHDNAGDFGSMKYWDPSLKKSTRLTTLAQACANEGLKVFQVVNDINNAKIAANPGWEPSADASLIISKLTLTADPINTFKKKITDYQKKKGSDNVSVEDLFKNEVVTLEDVRTCRQSLGKSIEEANILLNKYYRNDKRLHIPVMHLISALTFATDYFDKLYEQESKSQTNKNEELGGLRADMRQSEYEFTIGSNPNKSVRFTPTHYESYIQIYKSPEAAVKNYTNFLVLQKRKKDGEVLSSAEQKDYEKLTRMENLAIQFDTAHDYMLEKNSFSQQDVDYAFETSAQQQAFSNDKNKRVQSVMFDKHKSSGDAYQTLFLQKVFGGMEQRFLSASDEDSYMNGGKKNKKKLREWLEKDMMECLNKNSKEMLMILRGMKNAMPETDQTKDTILENAQEMILSNWIMKIFKGSSDKEKFASQQARESFMFIMEGKNSVFRRALEGIVKIMLEEDKLLAEKTTKEQKKNADSDKNNKITGEKIKKK